MKRFAIVASTLAVAISLGSLACGPATRGPGGRLPTEGRTPATVEVSDEAFAGAVRDLLTTPAQSPERSTRLEGVIARQMDRAHVLFHRKSNERGIAAVKGALYFLRPGDLKATTLGVHGVDALDGAVKDVAQHGDEGRSRALYEVLLRIAPPERRAEVQGHLDAIAAWTRAGREENAQASAGDTVSADIAKLESAADAQHVAVTRALLEPSADALTDATQSTRAWLAAAPLHPVHTWPRYEQVEGIRALQSAAATVIALHVRDADPRGAIEAIEHDERLKQTAPKRLFGVVAAVADKDAPDRWRDVLEALYPNEDGEDELVLDRDLLAAALLTAASEAYRGDPTDLRPALTLAELLQSFGMGEASPAVLVDACKAHPDAVSLEQSLLITQRALEAATEVDDPDAARRTYRAAEPILAIAEKAKLTLKTSPARVRGTMGEIELREGQLDVARKLLKSATSAEPSPSLLLDLARIERHDGDLPGALAHLKAAEASAVDPASRAEITLVSSDVLIAQGDAEGARKELGEALKALIAARNVREAVPRARIERAIARVYDRFGLFKQGDDAMSRARDATPRDKTQLAATLALEGSRAVVRNDLRAARDALSRAVTADLEDEDLVYFALWERAVERQQHAPTDGVADRVLASIPDDGSWASKLAAFGAGKLTADALTLAAQSPAKHAEALFYIALDKRAAGDRAGSDEALKQVVAGAGVDLIEAEVARHLLTPPAPLPPPLGVVASVP